MASHDGKQSRIGAVSYLRLSVTDTCDMQCAYCAPHRAAVPHARFPLSADEIAVLVRAFALNGVTKVRLTGGEPLLREDIIDIVSLVTRTPGIRTVALTTNGTRLAELAGNLSRAGLQRVNISLDSLDSETFRRINGSDRLDEVLRGLETVLRCGFEKVKVNTVVIRGVNDTELPAIADLACKLPIEARFIELMPLGRITEEWKAMYVPARRIREILGVLEPLPNEQGSSARLYSLPGGEGRVGIISPMSEAFCVGCNRVRVTSVGKLRSCLRLSAEADLRSLLDRPDLTARLGETVARMSIHKLSCDSAAVSAVQAEAMSALGG